MSSDHSSSAIRIEYDPADADPVRSIAEEVAGLSRRLDSFTVEMREGMKDLMTVLRIDRGTRSDLDERANQLERDVIEHRQRLGQLEQSAKKRLTAGKKRK